MSDNKREAIKERVATLREMLKVSLTFLTVLISGFGFIVFQVLTAKLKLYGLFIVIFIFIGMAIIGYISSILYNKIDNLLKELEND